MKIAIMLIDCRTNFRIKRTRQSKEEEAINLNERFKIFKGNTLFRTYLNFSCDDMNNLDLFLYQNHIHQ